MSKELLNYEISYREAAKHNNWSAWVSDKINQIPILAKWVNRGRTERETRDDGSQAIQSTPYQVNTLKHLLHKSNALAPLALAALLQFGQPALGTPAHPSPELAPPQPTATQVIKLDTQSQTRADQLMRQVTAQTQIQAPLVKGTVVEVRQGEGADRVRRILIQGGGQSGILGLKHQLQTILDSTLPPKSAPEIKQSKSSPTISEAAKPTPPQISKPGEQARTAPTAPTRTPPAPVQLPRIDALQVAASLTEPNQLAAQISADVAKSLEDSSLGSELQTVGEMGILAGQTKLVLNSERTTIDLTQAEQKRSNEIASELLGKIHQELRDKTGGKIKIPDEKNLARLLGLVKETRKGKQSEEVLDVVKLRQTLMNLKTNNPSLVRRVVDGMIQQAREDLKNNEYRELSQITSLKPEDLELIKSKLQIGNDEVAYMLALMRGIMTSENPAAISNQKYGATITYGGSQEIMVNFTHPGLFQPNLYKEIFAKTGAYSDATGKFQTLSTTYKLWVEYALALFGKDAISVANINGRTINVKGERYYDFSARSQDMAFMGYLANAVLGYIKANPQAHEADIIFELGKEFQSLPGAVNARQVAGTHQVVPTIREAYPKFKQLVGTLMAKQAHLNALVAYRGTLPQPTEINLPKANAGVNADPQKQQPAVTVSTDQAGKTQAKSLAPSPEAVKPEAKQAADAGTKPVLLPIPNAVSNLPTFNPAELLPQTAPLASKSGQDQANPYAEYAKGVMRELLGQPRPEIVELTGQIRNLGWKKVFAKGRELPFDAQGEVGQPSKITIGGELSALSFVRRLKNPSERKLVLEAIIKSQEAELAREVPKADLMGALERHFSTDKGHFKNLAKTDLALDHWCLYNISEALDSVNILPNTHTIDPLAQHSPHFFYHRFLAKEAKNWGLEALSADMLKKLGPEILDNALLVVPSSQEAADLKLIGKRDDSNPGLWYGHIAFTKVKKNQQGGYELATRAYRNNPLGNYSISDRELSGLIERGIIHVYFQNPGKEQQKIQTKFQNELARTDRQIAANKSVPEAKASPHKVMQPF